VGPITLIAPSRHIERTGSRDGPYLHGSTLAPVDPCASRLRIEVQINGPPGLIVTDEPLETWITSQP
jgi:hypothetical protein